MKQGRLSNFEHLPTARSVPLLYSSAMKAPTVLVLAEGKAEATLTRAAVLKCGARIVDARGVDVVLVVGGRPKVAVLPARPQSWKQYSSLVERAVNGARAPTRKGSRRRRARTS